LTPFLLLSLKRLVLAGLHEALRYTRPGRYSIDGVTAMAPAMPTSRII